MYRLSIWVPGRGWKVLLKTRSQRMALKAANTYLPLEVKLTLPNCYCWYAGLTHVGADDSVHMAEQVHGDLETQLARWDSPQRLPQQRQQRRKKCA
jgi:hypothetical protein